MQMSSSINIHVADESHILDLVSLMRIYCDTSDEPHVVKPTNDELIQLCQKILRDSEHEGLYLLARNDRNESVGFVALFWSWSLSRHSGRKAILSDLFVLPQVRGQGIAGQLIDECIDQARQRKNIRSIIWQTSLENQSAQKTYQRFGVEPHRCEDYELVLFKEE